MLTLKDIINSTPIVEENYCIICDQFNVKLDTAMELYGADGADVIMRTFDAHKWDAHYEERMQEALGL